ncbi:MAG: protein translocase subunit SecF, partial [Desulfobacteraceae bacterium 4572_19]
MQFIKPGINLNIIGKKNIGFIISLAALLISVASLVIHSGPNLGVDFVGGTLIQIKFTEPVTIDDVKKGLANANFNKPSVQQFGDAEDNEYLIRLSKAFSNVKNSEGANFAEEIQTAIKKSTGNTPDIRRVEMVGPQVGKDLREKALFAMF